MDQLKIELLSILSKTLRKKVFTCSIFCLELKVNHFIALYIGLLKPGGTVVEGTAGNTGIGLAHICNALGYKCVIFMPDTQSQVGYV